MGVCYSHAPLAGSRPSARLVALLAQLVGHVPTNPLQMAVLSFALQGAIHWVNRQRAQ
jgi:hypothetical protein